MQASTGKVSALNDPQLWLTAPPFDAPCPPHEVAAVQREIDSIVGVTRGNRSIAKIVWNGDRKFWNGYYDEWTPTGQPRGELQYKPHVLYKTVLDKSRNRVRDIFVPRWILLTRLEPEQYAPTWARDSKRRCRERNCMVQVRPVDPPAEYWLWQYTVADHDGLCCALANSRDELCFGAYAPPRAVTPYLEQRKRGLEAEGIVQRDPFKFPDRTILRYNETANNNYDEQAVAQFAAQTRIIASEAPLVLVGADVIADDSVSRAGVLRAAREAAERKIERFEQALKHQRKN